MKTLGLMVVSCVLFSNSLRGDDRVPGDFTLDRQLTVEDIDMLSRVIVTQHRWFDLNRDEVLSNADRDFLIQEAMNTWSGDANLDGSFDSSDFVQVFTAGEYDDNLTGNSTWSEGDFDGDGEFNSSDFISAFQWGGYEQGPRNGIPTWEIHGSGIAAPTPGTPRWFGDLDLDQALTAVDIDLLSAVIRGETTDSARQLLQERGFDVNHDGGIDQNDVVSWANELKNTWVGDANLDGKCDSSDLVLAFKAGEYEDEIVWNSTWSEGDWSGDLEFDSGDFVAAFSNHGCAPPPIRPPGGPNPSVATSVPEPSSLIIEMLALGVIVFALARRRRPTFN